MEAMIRIGDAAARLGVSVESLKRYERLGLIEPAQRNLAGQRVYREHELAAIRRVIVPERGKNGPTS